MSGNCVAGAGRPTFRGAVGQFQIPIPKQSVVIERVVVSRVSPSTTATVVMLSGCPEVPRAKMPTVPSAGRAGLMAEPVRRGASVARHLQSARASLLLEESERGQSNFGVVGYLRLTPERHRCASQARLLGGIGRARPVSKW